ncbi:epimerase [Brochothrix thermosphacta]|uniref:NAD-dependent epimerase/dehydratase family protein n=1 Tax=Brochothrix thermosphacta TaxID=2756 RepID=UPI000E717727|nr:NAD-dependent epimerase/dehydratase family protein [Brochothrix thermosphacta]ANZ95727.1 epimerase [Brochothrix thermosphacta]
MSNYLITGGAGFIGSNLANHLLTNHKVVVIDDLSMGSITNLNNSDKLTFIHGSVTDYDLMDKVLTDYQFDYIYHLAAIASVADSVDRPLATHNVNFSSVLNLIESVKIKQKGIKRLVFASSAAVYGDEPTLPKKEESVIRPLTPYAVDKFAAEKYVLAYNNLYNVPMSAVRFFNVYGPNQNPSSPYSGVISLLVNQFEQHKSGNKADFNIFGDGEQTRDFVYVKDVLNALLLVGTSEQSKGEVYNVGTGRSTTLNTLINTISEILDVELPIIYKEPRIGDITDSLANIDKLKSLNFEAEFDIKAGLTVYLERVKETS